MEITTPAQLQKAVDQAGVLLQAIHHYCETNNKTHTELREARVRFPRGVIRPAGLQRARIPFVTDKALKSNIAYTMILSVTVLWLSLRTDLWGTPREMLTKLYVFLLGTICESITKDYLTDICGKRGAPSISRLKASSQRSCRPNSTGCGIPGIGCICSSSTQRSTTMTTMTNVISGALQRSVACLQLSGSAAHFDPAK
jgi:hypothetical protein